MVVGQGQPPGCLPGDRFLWPELIAVLDWLPLASLLLAADGGALAVSHAWSVLSGLTVDASRADGWVSAVEPLDRGTLRARLRDAAAAGHAGYADARLVSQPDGRWSRWWWRPGPARRLLVCVADLGDFQGRDLQWPPDGRPPARLVRHGELLNQAGRALRRSHHGEDVAMVAVRLSGMADPGLGLLRLVAERISAAAGSAGLTAQIAPGEFVILIDDPRAAEQAGVIASRVRSALSQPLEADGTSVKVMAITTVAVAGGLGLRPEELIERASSAGRSADAAGLHPTGMLIQRLFSIGLALDSVSAQADGPVASQLQLVLDQLDGIIQDIRTAAFQPQVPHPRHDGEGP
jgi:hypothetical protein